ncbi:unnamed protein product [Calypogeia fissa]
MDKTGSLTASGDAQKASSPQSLTDMVHPDDGAFRERAAASTMVDTASPISTLSSMAVGALAEIHRVFNRCDMMNMDPSKKIAQEILIARGKKIVLHGVGREGLMMRAFTMRLFHLGLQASCLGDMTCPKLGNGDLFIASAGPGTFSSVDALMITAKEAGAKVLLVTAQPDGDAAKIADEVAWLPAQTMKEDAPEAGQLPVDRPWDPYSIPERPMEKLKDDPNGELGVAGMPGKEKTPQDMIRLEGGHIDREIVVACQGDPDNKILPMGSIYEGALYILFEIVTFILQVKLDETLEEMCARHTNME